MEDALGPISVYVRGVSLPLPVVMAKVKVRYKPDVLQLPDQFFYKVIGHFLVFLKTMTNLLTIKCISQQIYCQQLSPTRPEVVAIAATLADVGFIA